MIPDGAHSLKSICVDCRKFTVFPEQDPRTISATDCMAEITLVQESEKKFVTNCNDPIGVPHKIIPSEESTIWRP